MSSPAAANMSDEQLAAYLASAAEDVDDESVALAMQLQAEEDLAAVSLKSEQEKADLTFAAHLADDYESQRHRFIQKHTGAKVITIDAHERCFYADHGLDDEARDARQAAMNDYDEEEEDEDDLMNPREYYKLDPHGNIRLPGREKNNPQPEVAKAPKKKHPLKTASIGRPRRIDEPVAAEA